MMGQGWPMWKVYCSDFTGGIHTDLRILPVDFTSGIQGEAFVDLRWIVTGLLLHRKYDTTTPVELFTVSICI